MVRARPYDEHDIMRAPAESSWLQPRLLAARSLRYRESFHWRAHRHENYEIIAVAQGSYEARLDDQHLIVPPGAALLIQPGERHEDHCHPGLHCFALAIFHGPANHAYCTPAT